MKVLSDADRRTMEQMHMLSADIRGIVERKGKDMSDMIKGTKEIYDADVEALRREISTKHGRHCPVTSNPRIWVGSRVWSDGRNLYIDAECQECGKGDFPTSVRDSSIFHLS